MTGADPHPSDARGVAWDLDALMPGGAGQAQAAAHDALARARAFARTHRGQVASYEAAELSAACAELEQLHELLAGADAYATFRFDADTEPPEHGALFGELEELAAAVDAETTFFELEWIELDDARAERLLAEPVLERWAHMLRVRRLTRPHRLSEPEERLLTETALTGGDAWRRLYEERSAALGVTVDGVTVPLPEAFSELSAADREQRRRTADAITAALEPGLRTSTRILNVLLADHATEDRLRSYPHWLAARNLENETTDASVSALVDAVVGRYDIPRRWSRVKARALGLSRLADYDRSAPVTGEAAPVSWADAGSLIVESYARFSPELGRLARRFFDEGWIDAAPRPGKVGGAYCAPTTSACHPYVLISYAGRLGDVLTLAHEIGHGLHYLLAAPRGVLSLEGPITVSETASVFGETLAFGHLIERSSDPVQRWAVLAQQLDDAVATVFRQVAIHRFEAALHTERREEGELSTERIGELWMDVNTELYGDSVELAPGYATWWAPVSHIFMAPGYVYAYAYGQLLAQSIYARFLEQGAPFVPSYLELLRGGGSRSPDELTALVGIDLTDPLFWASGLNLIDEQLAVAERVADEVVVSRE